MRMILHGGQCCGIKHIYDLGWSPTSMLAAKRKTRKLKSEATCYMSSKKDFHYPSAPAETYLQRLDRYLAFLDTKRPKGICEIILSDDQLVHWRGILEERGFKLVNKCKNSNSGNMIHIYHRNKE